MKLRNKFRNQRKRSSSPTVENERQEMKKKKAKRFEVHGVPNYYPKPTVHGIELEERQLRLISGQGTADDLAETLPNRREEIIGGCRSVSWLKKRFPYLVNTDGVSTFNSFIGMFC